MWAPPILVLNWDSFDSSEYQPKLFHKHVCSWKVVGQSVIWLMRVPSGCLHVGIPVLTLLKYLASEQEETSRHTVGLCGRCEGVGCLAWSWEGQWVVCATVADRIVMIMWAMWCSFCRGSNPLLGSERTQFYTHTELYAWAAANLWVASTLRICSSFVLLKLQNKCIGSHRNFLSFDFHTGKFPFL